MNAAAIPLRPDIVPAPPLAPARAGWRFAAQVLVFVVLACMPPALTGWYLGFVAAPQFVSLTSFAVRAEQTPLTLETLGGLGALTAGSSSDADVVVDYLRSPALAAALAARLDLGAIWSAADDPLFALAPGASPDEVARFSGRMIEVRHNAQTGIISMTARAFDPDAAQTIAVTAVDLGAAMLNALADRARADATRDAEAALATAQTRLRAARQALAEFRAGHRLLDPASEAEATLGVITALQQQLAQDLIAADLLRAGSRNAGTDPRLAEVERRIAAIRARIEAEREPMGDAVQAQVLTDYEGLKVDLEFAETAYLAAMSLVETARAEAGWQSRYLATHVPPTRAAVAQYPRVAYAVACVGLFSFLVWAVVALAATSIAERRGR